jgi:predicted AAA+ superfamily ATPase
LIYSELSRGLDVAVDTITRWVELMVSLHFGFRVSPWFRNVNKALRKESKWFLRDWSGIEDSCARARTFVACHLLKAVEGWTDLGLGHFELRYVRDKLKREVDFLVVRDRKPWFLVEVGDGSCRSDSLEYFQTCTGARHAFQVVPEGAFVDADCFASTIPTVVPARTLLSQLL